MKAIILAGGQSTRMGQNKALMILDGKTIIQHVIDNLSSLFDEVFISGDHLNYPVSKTIIEDVAAKKGPMGGICSALEYCREDIFVCSCDMPFVSSELIKNMLQRKVEHRINVVCYCERVYPVLGIYPFSVLNGLKESIEGRKLKMISFLRQQDTHFINYDEDLKNQLLNINTPENFRNAEKIILSIKNEQE